MQGGKGAHRIEPVMTMVMTRRGYVAVLFSHYKLVISKL